jgi:hypothetical protein
MGPSGRWLCCFLLVGACVQPAPQEPSADPDVLALWEAGEIRSADFDAYLLTLPPAQRWPEPAVDPVAWRNDRLDELFLQRVVGDLEVAARLDEDERFQLSWKLQRRSALAAAYLERQAEDLEVTTEDARRYFERFGHELDAPETRVLANILLSVPAGADAAAWTAVCARAEALRRDIEGGASFEAMARLHSASSTAAQGGLIGAVRRDQLRGDAGEVVFGLETGRVSRVVRTAAGCQLFLVRQIAPAYAARFEAVLPQIMSRLREAKATAAYLDLYRTELSALGVESPTWDEAAGAEAFAVERVCFEVDAEQVTGLDVLQRVRTGVPPPQALAQLASELVLAAAMERAAPEDAARRAAAARRTLVQQYLQTRAAERQIEELPEDDLRRHFDAQSTRFVTEPAVELTLVSWPIGAGDPLRWMERPRAFVTAVEAARGRTADAWPAFAEDEDVRRRSVPLTPLRTLAEREPSLADQLLGELRDGQVIGPFASGRRLEVLVVDSYLPSRPLTFVEAMDRVRRDYAQHYAGKLARQRLDDLQRARGFRRFDEHLANLGFRLLDDLLQPTLDAAGDG